MHSTSAPPSRAGLFATALAALGSAALIWAMVRFLRDAALAAVPFGGHTLVIGTDYVWANRVAALFLIVACALLAHSVARVIQIAAAWRQRIKIS